MNIDRSGTAVASPAATPAPQATESARRGGAWRMVAAIPCRAPSAGSW